MIIYFVIENFGGTFSSVNKLKGYILICWNAEGVHGQRKVGNPWLDQLKRMYGSKKETGASQQTVRRQVYMKQDKCTLAVAIGLNLNLSRANGSITGMPPPHTCYFSDRCTQLTLLRKSFRRQGHCSWLQHYFSRQQHPCLWGARSETKRRSQWC